MSNYMSHYRALCLWCMGDGPAYHGEYTSGAEEWFKCLSCGQEYYAEGDYLEHVTAKGGYGVLLCSSKVGKLPRPYRLHVQWRSEESIFCYRLSGNAKVDGALAKRLIARSSWVMVTTYECDRAAESNVKCFDLKSTTRQDAVLHGTPPPYDKLIESLLNGLGFDDEDDELYALLSTKVDPALLAGDAPPEAVQRPEGLHPVPELVLEDDDIPW